MKMLTKLGNAFSSLRRAPKLHVKAPITAEKSSAMSHNVASTPSRATRDLLASGCSPEYLIEATKEDLIINKEAIAANETQLQALVKARQAIKEGQTCPDGAPRFTRPELVDKDAELAEEMDPVQIMEQHVASLKEEEVILTANIAWLQAYILQKSSSGEACGAGKLTSISEEDFVKVEDHESEMGDDEEIPVEMTRGQILK